MSLAKTNTPSLVKEATVVVKVAELYDALLRQQAADHCIGAFWQHPCPPDPTGDLCRWCGRYIRTSLGDYVGHSPKNHDEACPWRQMLDYAAVFYREYS